MVTFMVWFGLVRNSPPRVGPQAEFMSHRRSGWHDRFRLGI